MSRSLLRRLTRIHVRSVEQPVNLDDGDDVFNYPWLYAVEVGHWQLTDSQVKQMRDFLDRGGFFMCDDFHGTQEWAVFMETMQRVFPDRPGGRHSGRGRRFSIRSTIWTAGIRFPEPSI